MRWIPACLLSSQYLFPMWNIQPLIKWNQKLGAKYKKNIWLSFTGYFWDKYTKYLVQMEIKERALEEKGLGSSVYRFYLIFNPQSTPYNFW